MSDIDNSNFDRNTKLDPATLNAKFNDVTVATSFALNGDNIRNSGVDVYNLDTTNTDGKSGTVLKWAQMATIGTAGPGLTVNFESGATGLNGVSVGSDMTVNPAGTPAGVQLKTGDILRVYWTVDVDKAWTAANKDVQYEFWALWLQWHLSSFGAGAFGVVPKQGNYNTNLTFGYGNQPEDNYAASFIQHASIISNNTSVANNAPTDAVLAVNSESYIGGDIGVRTTVSGCYHYVVEAPYNNLYLEALRVVVGGMLQPYYDVGTNKNYFIVDPTQPSTPVLKVYDATISMLLMEPD
jgi:hypothetical protein